jgi:hypothetical protein
LGQCPSDTVAIGLVNQPVTAVLILRTASAGINAVFLLEFLGQLLRSNRLDITADGIFHLDAVAGVLKGNPLHAVPILPHNERSRCRDRARSCVRVVDTAGALATRAVKLRSTVLGVLGLGHRRALRLLELERDLGFKLGPGASSHTSLGVLGSMLSHVVLRCGMRHHHVRL